MHKRPSDHELLKRLKEAKEYLEDKPGLFANPAKVVGELNTLEIGDSNEIWELIRELLGEISPQNYCGTKPPQKSYEKSIEGLELFAFCWESQKLGKQMYLKFALKKDRFYYVSLHPSKISKQEGVV